MATEIDPRPGEANDIRMAIARRIIEECFWGDYLLAPEELLSRLDSGEPGFDRRSSG